MKRYTLDKGTIGSPVLEIEASLAENARAAKKVIINMLTSEEKYDAVIENFVEFERTLLDTTLDLKMFGGRTEDWFNIARNRIDRRFFNLLSSCRSYYDFGRRCAKRIGADMNQFEVQHEQHREESFGYRVMHLLRDHVTHAGNAAHIVTFSMQREDLEDNEFILAYHTPTLELSPERLVGSERSSSLLNEIDINGGEINLTPLLQEYLRRLSQMHDFFRGLCRPNVNRSRQILDSILKMFRKAHSDTADFNGLVVREYDGEKKKDEFWIVPNANRLDYFEAKNRVLSNLERSRVTNAMPLGFSERS